MNIRLFLTSKVWKEDKYYIAYNPELDVASQGKTIEEAQAMLKDALSLFIETAKDMGTLNIILREAGFVKKEKRWTSPLISLSPLEMTI
jgi:predicted RNase H-like HicB family nuclease